MSCLELVIYLIQVLNEWTNKWMPDAGHYEDGKQTGLGPELLSLTGVRTLQKGGVCSEWERRGLTLWGVCWEAWWTKGHLSYDMKCYLSEKLEKRHSGNKESHVKVHKGPKEHSGTFRNLQWPQYGREVADRKDVAWKAGQWSLGRILSARLKTWI